MPTEPAVKKPFLNPRERAGAALVALVAIGLVVWLLIGPPLVTQAKTGTACLPDSCTVEVAADTDTVTTALVALAALMSLVAVLGVRFTRLKGGGFEASTEPSVAEIDPKSATKLKLAPALALAPEPKPVADPEAWEALPDWAQRGLRRWAEGGDVVTRPLSRAVVESSPAEGQGTKARDVAILLDDDAVRTLRVTAGRGGAAPGGDD